MNNYECRSCGLDQPAENYHRSSTSPTGFKSTCKVCCSVADRAYRARKATPAVQVVLAALDLLTEAELDIVRDAVQVSCPVVPKTPRKVDPFAASVESIWNA